MTMGPMCESEVVKYLFHPDQGTRTEAQRLLKSYGTKDSVILPQALGDLKSTDGNRRINAAAWLAQTPVVEARRGEVSAALNAVLRDPIAQVRQNGVKATAVWGTKDNVPGLISFVDDNFASLGPPPETFQAMEQLIAFKDERAFWPIAHYCGHPFENAKGRKYLQQIGPAAEPEVVKHLTDANAQTRQVAWKAIAVVGIKANLESYKALAMKEADGLAKLYAQQSLAEIAKQ
jgi:HEAT repeat protein